MPTVSAAPIESSSQSSRKGQDAAISNCPVSVSKIQPNIAHPVMQARVKGQLGKSHVYCGTLPWDVGCMQI